MTLFCYDIIISTNEITNIVNVKIIKKVDKPNNDDNNNSNNKIFNFEICKLTNDKFYNNKINGNKFLKFLNQQIEIQVVIIQQQQQQDTTTNTISDINGIKIDEFLIQVGSKFRQEKKMEDALRMYYLSSRSNENNSTSLFYLGVAFYESGEIGSIELALECYEKSLELNPYHQEALCNAGVIYKNQGNIEKAIQYYNRSIEINPNYNLVKNNLSIAYNDFGTLVKSRGDIKTAKLYYKKSLFYNFKHAETYYNLGVLYSTCLKNIEKSIINYELAIHFNSVNSNSENKQYTEALNNLGVVYKDIDNIDQAINYYQLALKSNPGFSQSLNNLSIIYTMQGRMKEAKLHAKRAIKESPSYAEALNTLGVIYRDIGKIEKSIACYQNSIQLAPQSLNSHHNKLLALNYSTKFSQPEIFNLHKEWGIEFQNFSNLKAQQNNIATITNTNCTNVDGSGDKDKLIIGYISGDFFIHSVSYFIEGILKHHDKEQFKIICYSNVNKPDKTTDRLKGYGHEWRHITGKSTLEVVEIIKQDKVDILVELSGHTCGNRLDVMAFKPAPIQISYIGYPNSTGLPSIQYRLTDSIVDPINTNQQFTESLIRLPQCFLTYFPPIEQQELVLSQQQQPLQKQNNILPPVLKNGYITFGSFNVLAKYSDQCLTCWKLIMDKSPINSKLLLKSKPFACEQTKKSFLKRLSKFGFNLNQIELVGLIPCQQDHLNLYSTMLDISLDTFPYAGTTTTCESLWMGVPVITLSLPDCHSNNVGKSILSSLNLTQLIATSQKQYIQIALDLANDLQQLKQYKLNLRNIMIHSSLCDNLNFTKTLELKYKQIYLYHLQN